MKILEGNKNDFSSITDGTSDHNYLNYSLKEDRPNRHSNGWQSNCHCNFWTPEQEWPNDTVPIHNTTVFSTRFMNTFNSLYSRKKENKNFGKKAKCIFRRGVWIFRTFYARASIETPNFNVVFKEIQLRTGLGPTGAIYCKINLQLCS